MNIENINDITMNFNDSKWILDHITNTQKFKGAAAIMNRKALRTFTQKYRTNILFVLPSSIHEMMIAPYDSNLNLDDLSAMVKEINETQVAPEERLTDRAYIITLCERKIYERIVNRLGDLQRR